MKTTQLILVDKQLEYTLEQYTTKKGKVTELKYSMSESWSDHVRGKRILKILDNGDGLKLFKTNLKRLDYDDALELAIVLNKAVCEDLNIEMVDYNDHNKK